MDIGVCMYQRSTTSTAESLNAANKSMRERSAINVRNAVILLMKLEKHQHQGMTEAAWNHDHTLTLRGIALSVEASKQVPNFRAYTINTADYNKHQEFSVKGNHPNSVTQSVRILREPFYGCRGYTCTCGVPKMDGVPCRHVVAVVKSGRARGDLNMINIMPYWWTTHCWREQFPKNEVSCCSFDMAYLKEKYAADKSIHYCPDFAAPRKRGRPKNNACFKSPIKVAITGKKKRKVDNNTGEKKAKNTGCK